MRIREKWLFVLLAALSGCSLASSPRAKNDHTVLRLYVQDAGVVLRHGLGPNNCDQADARGAVIIEEKGTYYLFYNGSADFAIWHPCLAISKDLVHWNRQGAVNLIVIGYDNNEWHFLYATRDSATIGRTTSPFITLRATAPHHLAGPWAELSHLSGLVPEENTWYSQTVSAGHILSVGGEYLMFFSGSCGMWYSIGIARTQHLSMPWEMAQQPILPGTEQIQGSSIWFDSKNQRWFLFTSHINTDNLYEARPDAILVYWTRDLKHWSVLDKAIVLDNLNCTWARLTISAPTVFQVGDRLAILYDGQESTSPGGDIGLAWLDIKTLESVR